MFKAGALPAPVIKPLRYDTIGTRIKVGPNTYIQIQSDVPGGKIYFTTDGTKPDQFQVGRTGKPSTHKYIGPFRLQPGNRVVRAIAVTRDRLRESAVATRYIDVTLNADNEKNNYRPYSDHEQNDSSYSDDDQPEFMSRFPRSQSGVVDPSKNHQQLVPFGGGANDMAEIQGSIDGPINPVNYSGTQINIWGFPTPDIGNLIEPKASEPKLGYLTDQMIKNLNTPRPAEPPRPPGEFDELPETLKKFFKQIKRLYERDSEFQHHLDTLIDKGQVKSAHITEKFDSFLMNVTCPKFLIDHKPKPPPIRPRSPSPEVIISNNINKKPEPEAPPKVVQPLVEKPKPPPSPPPKPPVDEGPKIYIEELQQQGTIADAPNFNPSADSENLKNSVKGLGTKEKVIIDIVGNRSNAQRQKIKDSYKVMFGRDVVEDLKGDTSGNFKKLLVGLFMTPVEFDCVEIRKAIQGLGTDNSALIEILTSRSNKRIKDMSDLYYQLYKKKMEDDIVGDTSGAYKRILVSLLTGTRPETQEVDMNLVRKDVDDLVAAGIKKLGTDEAKFNTIFGVRSYAHLRQMFDEYQKKTGKSIEDSIKSEMSGNLSKTYLALISNIRNRPAYFAKEIKKAIKGLGTDEHTLNRIIVSRCEVDTKQIKEEYEKQFKVSMEKDIKDDVSGEYGKLLLLLLKDPSARIYLDEKGAVPDDKPHVVEKVEEPKIEETPTVVDQGSFNASSDSERLRKAMQGLGTDEKTIIEILGNRTNKQRQELKTVFQQMHGRDLVKDLQSETSGNFKEILEALMMTPVEFDAFQFNKAVKGLGTDELALIELLTTRSAEQLVDIKSQYQTKYNKSLEADIKGDTSGSFRNVLVSLLSGGRETGNMVDKTQAKIDAQTLITMGPKKWLDKDSKFTEILCTRSYSQLRAMFNEYEVFAEHPIADDIRKEISGDLQKSFIAIVECIRDKQAFFASQLCNAMKGLGTKDTCLIRITVSRSEVDMVQIKQKFEALYKKSLADWIKGDTSGDYMKTLLTLIGEASQIKK